MQRGLESATVHSSRASKHWVLPLGKGPPYLRAYRTVSMIPTNAAIAISNVTVLSAIETIKLTIAS